MREPLVSVIVPTYNSGSDIEGCLRSIASQSYVNIELIVVDNNSQDATKELAGKYTGLVFNRGPERSAQRNYGVHQSKGDLLLIIDSDMLLAPDVVKACVEEYSRGGIKSIVIPEESIGEGFWAQCKKLERSFYVGVSWMEAARFFEKSIFQSMGGYNEENTGTEDYDLPQRIEYTYGGNSTGRISALIYHNEQRLTLLRSCKKKYYYAQRISIYASHAANVANFRKQSSLLSRYTLFLSHPARLLRNPILAVGMLLMKACELGAAGMGYLRGRLFMRHHIA